MTIRDFIARAGGVVPDTNYKTPDWAIWRGDAAGVVTDADEIEQSLILIASTAKGSDPMRPEFGNDYMPLLDLPVTAVAGRLVASTSAAFAAWEPRAKVTSVTVSSTAQGRLNIVFTWERVAAPNTSQPVTSSVSL